MSLTSLLKQRDVRERFRKEFPKPILSFKMDIAAPPLTNHYSLVGTAFDYLLRFYIEYLNRKCIYQGEWIAEESVDLLLRRLSRVRGDIDFENAGKLRVCRKWPEWLKKYANLCRKMHKLVLVAKKQHASFLKTGKADDDLLRTILGLAQIDPYFRAGFLDENLGKVSNKDVQDLVNLYSLVDSEIFGALDTIVLNPTFGMASQLVGGADADLIADDMIIEIKTTKKLQLTRDVFNQLVGYYILHKMGGIDGLPRRHKINTIGIYFSRFGCYHTISVKDIINRKTFDSFLVWFKKRIERRRIFTF